MLFRSMWAFPVALSAKEQMRGVSKDWDRYRGQAKRLAAHIEKEFATEKIYEQFIKTITKNIVDTTPKVFEEVVYE